MIGPCWEIKLVIGDERRDALVSALRHADGVEAIELLDQWELPSFDAWDAWTGLPSRAGREHDLSEWVRDECRLHVEGGRFHYALALLDRYLVLPLAFDSADDRIAPSRIAAQ